MQFFRQEHWSRAPGLPPGDLPDPGIEPTSLLSPAFAGRFFTTRATWEAYHTLQGIANLEYLGQIKSVFLILLLHLSQWLTLFFWAPKSLQMVIAAMKLKDAYSLEGSYDQPRQHIKNQRHYFVNKGPSSQGYGFSSGYVWM